MSTSFNLMRLAEITESLPSWQPKDGMGTCMQIGTKRGTSLIWGLLKESGIAVANTFFSKGSVLEEHSHDQKEYLIIYKGRAVITVEGVDTILTVGDSIVFEIGQTHSQVCEEDTWLIAVTIPESEVFPNA